MQTIQFIKQYGVKALSQQLAIEVVDKCGLLLLNYNQLESPKKHPIAIECRSLVLNAETFDIVSRSFDRFFNLGEDSQNDNNSNDWVELEKADGSLIGIYFNPIGCKFEIRTRGTLFAEASLRLFEKSYRDQIIEDMGWINEDGFQLWCDANLYDAATYIFEYVGFHNPHITRYTKNELVLTGIRHNRTGTYSTVETMQQTVYAWNNQNIRCVKSTKFNSFDDVLKKAQSLKNLEEGFVVWNTKKDQRVKVKNPSYLQVHKLHNNGVFVSKRIVGLILLGDADEVLTYFPEYTNVFKPHIERVNAQLEEINRLWNEVKHIEDQKEFALAVKSNRQNGLFFVARKTNSTPIDILGSLDVDAKVKFFI
jgi:hypothetical protein